MRVEIRRRSNNEDFRRLILPSHTDDLPYGRKNAKNKRIGRGEPHDRSKRSAYTDGTVERRKQDKAL